MQPCHVESQGDQRDVTLGSRLQESKGLVFDSELPLPWTPAVNLTVVTSLPPHPWRELWEGSKPEARSGFFSGDCCDVR